VDDRSELSSVCCSIDFDAVCFIDIELRFKLKLPAGGDCMATGNATVLKIKTGALLLIQVHNEAFVAGRFVDQGHI